jgi:threonine aldolase
MKKGLIDLRSDAVTKPSVKMLESIKNTTFCDHIIDKDPTVSKFEKFIVKELGKEKAILLPSGTMGNLVAIMSHSNPGNAIILGKNSHINLSECGGVSFIAGLQTRQIKETNGYLDPVEIKNNILLDDSEFSAKATIFTFENTHNLDGGITLTVKQTKNMCKVARKYGLLIHLDGARLFNAAIALNVPPRDLTMPVDSVMVSFSKGLAAPFGSVLAGSEEFILKANRIKKMIGGGMRQEGLLSSIFYAGYQEFKDSLVKDHENARLLANGLKNINGINIDFSGIRTNIVFFSLNNNKLSSQKFLQRLEENNIRASAFGLERIRMVTHKDIVKEDIEFVIKTIEKIINSNKNIS